MPKISDLTQGNQAAIDKLDKVVFVDVDDTAMAATGTTKFTTVGDLAGAIGRNLIGRQNFADTATASTPLQITPLTGGEVKLTNNASGTLTDGTTITNSNSTIEGLNDLWNSTANTIDFGDLEENDTLIVRIGLKLTPNSVLADYTVRLDFYDGAGGTGTKEFDIAHPFVTLSTSAIETPVEEDVRFFIGSSVVGGSCEIFIECNQATDVEVVGFDILILKNN
jgi:hypothetical protein